ncbi:MAG: hypothetical protein HQL41_08895 [Alphaproteobacteria bacterium]|nr:hypothetical protein [Alphaproteobacteria bacterium]
MGIEDFLCGNENTLNARDVDDSDLFDNYTRAMLLKKEGRQLPDEFFDRDRNLKLTDLKTLLKAAGAVGDFEAEKVAKEAMVRFVVGREV